MTTSFKEYTIDIVDDANYTLGSADNSHTYDRVYFEKTEYRPTSKHGIRITRDGQSVASAIICENGGATGIHDNSFIITGDVLLICCSDAVYSFKLPTLELNWKKKLDAVTCFGIYPFKGDYIFHGPVIELMGKALINYPQGHVYTECCGPFHFFKPSIFI